MKYNATNPILTRLLRMAMAMFAGGIVAAPSVYANSSNNIVLVPPAELPALARQAGEAMFLHDTIDGRTLLYIEQNHGSRLATFDVTNPVHIKGEATVHLGASGPFDFVAPLGDRAELVRFRQSNEDAVLDFPRVKAPNLKAIQGLTLEGIQPPRDYQFVDTGSSRELNRVFDVKQVRVELTKTDTGTTFMLTDNGLYVIRRPAVESIHQVMMITPN